MKARAYLGSQWYNNILLHACAQNSIEFTTEINCDFVFLDNMFWVNKRRVDGDSAMHDLARQISLNFQIPIIAIDHCDVPLPKYSNRDIENFDLVLKAQCLPRDRELLNWEIGVRYGLNRSKKIKKVPDDQLLSAESIEKHKLSFDLGLFRAFNLQGPEPPLPSWNDSDDAFFVGSFNSLNRLNGLKILKNNFKTTGWLTKLDPTHPIVGVKKGSEPMESARLIKSNSEFFGGRIDPLEFMNKMRGAKACFAFSGIGELGERHYQAFEINRLLVCEDLDYLETIFPFKDGVNYIKVEETLGDLSQKMEDIVAHENQYLSVSQKGSDDYFSLYSNPAPLIKKYFLDYIL